MVMEDISARGAKSRRSNFSHNSSSDEEGKTTQRGKIKSSHHCEMFKFVKLGKKIGEGAYGEVFQALNTKDHKFIVVKKMPIPDNMKNKDAVDEIDMLTKLEHPNIVKYHDSCLHKAGDHTEI